jgi:endoglucanase
MTYRRRSIIIFSAAILLGLVLVAVVVSLQRQKPADRPQALSEHKTQPLKGALAGRHFYNDETRAVVQLARQYKSQGKTAEAKLLNVIASQPGTTWLTGPSANDPTAEHDIAAVARTSAQAAANGTTPVYELYAIPDRDACAGYSKDGFANRTDYLAWIDRILANLQGDAVFSVEADAVAQTLNSGCMSAAQISDRYALLTAAIHKLHGAPHVVGIYLDAGNPEWFPDPAKLVTPLTQAGVGEATGVAVNVSYFIPTKQAVSWSQKLVGLLGGTQGVIIDTSRNGKGAAPPHVTGEARWCNPPGRGIGPAPTTYVPANHIDAYFWGKNIGESDGACFGNPPAGTFVPALALALARNR